MECACKGLFFLVFLGITKGTQRDGFIEGK